MKSTKSDGDAIEDRYLYSWPVVSAETKQCELLSKAATCSGITEEITEGNYNPRAQNAVLLQDRLETRRSILFCGLELRIKLSL